MGKQRLNIDYPNQETASSMVQVELKVDLNQLTAISFPGTYSLILSLLGSIAVLVLLFLEFFPRYTPLADILRITPRQPTCPVICWTRPNLPWSLPALLFCLLLLLPDSMGPLLLQALCGLVGKRNMLLGLTTIVNQDCPSWEKWTSSFTSHKYELTSLATIKS